MDDNYNVVCKDPAILDLCFVIGDSFPFFFDFPFDISFYTIEAKINGKNISNTATATRINLNITPEVSGTLQNHMTWYLKLVKGEIATTCIKGKFLSK